MVNTSLRPYTCACILQVFCMRWRREICWSEPGIFEHQLLKIWRNNILSQLKQEEFLWYQLFTEGIWAIIETMHMGKTDKTYHNDRVLETISLDLRLPFSCAVGITSSMSENICMQNFDSNLPIYIWCSSYFLCPLPFWRMGIMFYPAFWKIWDRVDIQIFCPHFLKNSYLQRFKG